MNRNIKRFSQGQYDVLIIGGGINGAAVANLASLSGLNVALIEKDDFASGTSSKSTKLIHGGLRYLEQLDFGLVKESLRERAVQLKSAPHLVKSCGFIIPVYKTDQRPLWMMKLGVTLYDFLSGKYNISPHRALSREEIIHLIPDIKKEDLMGGVIYYDAQMDDARLCLENILNADQYGAHVANYVEFKSFVKENGKVVGVVAYDKIGNESFEIRARKVVCAVGPWTDSFMHFENKRAPQKVRTTKGVHIVHRGQVSEHAVFLQTQKDKRMFFIIPYHENMLIGTTDTDFTGNPNQVDVEDEDIEYLLKEAKRVFPKNKFSTKDIITTFAGLRPLVFKSGSPSKLSRNHVIEESYTGAYYIMGGKYTTYRKIAEDCLKKISKKKLVDTKDLIPLYSQGSIEADLAQEAKQYEVSQDVITNLINTYGSRYTDVLALTKTDPSLKENILPDLPMIKAQIQYALSTEMAVKEEDVMTRRLSLTYQDYDHNQCLKAIRQIMAVALK